MNQYLDQTDELCHFGIFGMKWGVRRYQNEDGSRTLEGRRHYGYKNLYPDEAMKVYGKEKREYKARLRATRRAEKKLAKEIKKQEKLEAQRKAREAERQRVIREGTAEEVLKFRKELTTEEKREVNSRLQEDEKLLKTANAEAERRARLAEQNSKWNKAMRVAKKAGEAAGAIESSVRLYNQAAKIVNAFSDSELPVVGEKKKTNKETRSMQMAQDLVKNYWDKSLAETDVEVLEEANAKIGQLATLEKLAKGSGN